MAEADIAKTQPKGFSSLKSVCRAKFDELKKENRPAFVGYLPYGFPDPEKSIMMFETLVRNGADIVEIGLPYSDPVMDGTIIQNACSAALANGEKISGVFRAVETVAKEGAVPLVMSYWNILFHYGIERFSRDFVNAGGAGIVTPDLIPDEAGHGSYGRKNDAFRNSASSRRTLAQCGKRKCLRGNRHFHSGTGKTGRSLCRRRYRGLCARSRLRRRRRKTARSSCERTFSSGSRRAVVRCAYNCYVCASRLTGLKDL